MNKELTNTISYNKPLTYINHEDYIKNYLKMI